MLFQCVQNFFYSSLSFARTNANTIEESKNIHKVSIETLDETKFPIDYIGNCWLFCVARDLSKDGVNKDIIFEMRWNHSIKNDRAISFWNTIYHAINLSQCVAVRESFAKNFFFVKSWLFFFRLRHNEFYFAENFFCGVCLFFFCFAVLGSTAYVTYSQSVLRYAKSINEFHDEKTE